MNTAAIEILNNELAGLQRRVAANDATLASAHAAHESFIADLEANTASLQPRIAELQAAIALVSAPPATSPLAGVTLAHYSDLLAPDGGLVAGVVAEATGADGNVYRSAPLLDSSDLLERLAKPESVRDLLDAIEKATGYDYERLTRAIVDARDLDAPTAEPEPAPEPKRGKRHSKAPVSLSTGPEQPVVDADAEAGK